MTGDFANCFFDPTGRDIEDGRLTWLVIAAYQRANAVQRKALVENYGTEEPSKAGIVKQVSLAYKAMMILTHKLLLYL